MLTIELESLSELRREVFGPVLHVVRYRRRDLGALLGQINATGYGLTLGVHTRIDETISQVVGAANAGNVYVNRNMVGAVVGVQPFGGEGLSGTGPKAGGPLYMYRMLSHRPDDVLSRAIQSSDSDQVADTTATPGTPALDALAAWADRSGARNLVKVCASFKQFSRSGCSRTLAGPTGERNVYTLMPRHGVLCLAQNETDYLTQLAAVLAVNSAAVWPTEARSTALFGKLPANVKESIVFAEDWSAATVEFDAVLHHGEANSVEPILRRLADKDGPIVGVRTFLTGVTDVPLEALVIERALSVNTAAAGGNASLMTID